VPKALGIVLLAPVVILGLTAAAGWMRSNAPDPFGFLATLAVAAGFGALWLWISMRLPSPDLPWTAFLPGAVLFAVGVEGLHLFTTYFLQERLANASELYGVLGLATTALFFLFLVGRGVVWAAELNAVVWEARTAGRQTS
jgi:uncharacterized BrkB/YihY/UPF0761 family membrane protein